ncbi:MAG: NAD(P)-dependent oxidoreductase [Gammaproteobacteria bacterium]|nr:NAD(P)-dependent oxidoreductase [Gammaproteobacteria bacterium]
MARVAFIGLGVMGYPMAGHLAAHGHQLVVYNRSPAKAERWQQQHGGHIAASPAEAAAEADFVCLCVGNDEDVRQLLTGSDGVLSRLKPGTIIIDHTTTSATLAEEMARACAAVGGQFMDAPVSGGQSGAQNGVLTVMVGGDAEAFARAEPVIASYAKRIRHLGVSGNGQKAKMVNQICIAGLVQALAEGVHFAEQAGLDIPLLFDTLGAGAAQSWQMDNRHLSMHQRRFDFGFAVDWMRKDLGIALTEAKANGAALPVTALVDQFYAEVQASGGQRLDTSSLLLRLAACAPATD